MKPTTIAVLCIALPISSCSLIGSVDQPLDSAPAIAERLVSPQINPQIHAQPDPQKLIARDFVNVLSQMDGMQADATTVAVLTSDRQDGFTLAVHDALEEAGYGIRWVAEAGAGPLFQYRKDKEQAAGGVYRDTYELAVGSIEMRRGYASDSQRRVRPVTPLYVRGADASKIVLNEKLFDPDTADASIDTNSGTTTSATTATTVSPIDSEKTSAQTSEAQIQTAGIDAVSNAANTRHHSNTSPTLALQNSSRLQVPDDANPLDPLVARAAVAPSVSLPLLAPAPSQNVFDLGGSNFQNLLTEHEVVREQILTFANDSMRLGQLNKQLINQLVDSFDPKTDMFSVIGCSMGPTAVKGGNAALALGRADRVVDALRFAGVDSKLILDEGCWAGDGSLESLPRRGVVLTLNRRG